MSKRVRSNKSSRSHAGNQMDTLEDRRLMTVGPATVAGATVNDTVYDSASGDLHVIYYTASAKSLSYQVFHNDGTSDPAVVIDSSGDTGGYCSLARDSNGILHAAYYDGINGDLKYARRDLGGVWSTRIIDARSTVGLYPSITIDATGQPAIAYYHKTAGDLKLAQFDGTSWAVGVVSATNDVGRSANLGLNPSTQKLGIAYVDSTSGAFLYAERTSKSWYFQSIDGTTRGGGYVSLSFNPVSKQPAISYYDAYNADLKYAERSTRGKWSQFTVVARNTIGLYTDLAWTFDTANPAIVFYNRTNDVIQLAYRQPNLTWVFETEATGGRNVTVADGPSISGSIPSLFMVYNDTSGSTLKIEEIA